MPDFDFAKLVTDGGIAGALIFVVILFLKQLDKINALVGSITSTFNETISNLVKDHTYLTRETVSAVKDLTTAVTKLGDRIGEVEDKLDVLTVPAEVR